MTTFDLINNEFRFTNTSIIDKMEGVENPDTILIFSSTQELINHLVDDVRGDRARMQSKIHGIIDADQTVQTWKNKRTNLQDLTHFPRYRDTKYDCYHNAARAIRNGTPTSDQVDLAYGLEAEILSSKVTLPLGQVLFHGRCNQEPDNGSPYPAFLSTSLCPVVALNSALRRAGENYQNGRPTIYVLTMQSDLPALWGQMGDTFEYELLFPPNLQIDKVNEWQRGDFDIVTASIAGRSA